MPHLSSRINHELLQDFRDANKNPSKLLGTINLSVQLAFYNIRVNRFVCESIAAPMILGNDFCDKFVQAM